MLISSPILLSVAGMVGVGKTTFAAHLADSLGLKMILEKVEGNPYLDDYYRDFKKWSFHMQIYFLIERFKEQNRIHHAGRGIIQDRTIFEDAEIFARIQYERGNMSQRDYETYSALYESIIENPYFSPPTLVIYLYGPFEKIMERIERRGRKSEITTPLSYWKELYSRYEEWISHFTAAPVLKINIDDYDLFESTQDLHKIDRLIEKNLELQKVSIEPFS
ncbi:Deoxyadenosine/deoxycytidine kinase [[Clostridium] ultunense Esp]|nr:Deoxyadenosine/deoxycytidine kinase [[Clostridium] ultunense Esp]